MDEKVKVEQLMVSSDYVQGIVKENKRLLSLLSEKEKVIEIQQEYYSRALHRIEELEQHLAYIKRKYDILIDTLLISINL